MRSFHVFAGLATLCLILAANFYFFFQSVFNLTSILPSHTQAEVDGLLQKTRQLEYELQFAQADASSAAEAFSSASARATASAQLATSALADKLATSQLYPGNSSTFAYVFYATQNAYACSALVNIARLHALNTTIAIHVLLAPTVDQEYHAAFYALNATVHVLPIPHPAASPDASRSAGYYANCFLKLSAFRLHQLVPSLQRILILDSDQLIFRNLDNLFTSLPAVDLAAPRAYWLRRHFLSSTFMLVDLSDRLWQTVESAVESAGVGEFDMDLVNRALGNTSLVLGGEYVVLDFHWETWSLPNWWHGAEGRGINWTTVNGINELARAKKKGGGRVRRQLETPSNAELATPPSTEASLASNAGPPDTSIVALPPVPPSIRPAAPEALSEAPRLPPQDASTLQTPVSPRFPATHPLFLALTDLRQAAAIVHFTAVGKPWQFTPEGLRRMRPDAHPMLAELVGEWRGEAGVVCPRWNGGKGLGG